VSVLLARGFLAPIRRLARATHRLAAGDYAQRISVDRRDELGQLVDDFNAMAAKLQQAETARRAFLADVSHELRTPLAILRGEIEALQDGVRSLSPEALKSLQAEVGALSALVDDLHELTNADVGSVQYEHADVDIAGLLRATLYAFRDRFAARALAVDTAEVPDERVVVVGDSRRLTQLFNNLFENTLRYTDEGGRVEVGLRTSKDGVELDLQDSAPGVPKHLRPRLFERLFRVESSRNRALGGTGLGLALCRSIVEMHGGDIQASASGLGGLRIVVHLPRAGHAHA
jgi:two-component system sensor histidine kinase BaeS